MKRRDHPLNHGSDDPYEPYDASRRAHPVEPPRRWSHQPIHEFEVPRRDER